VRVVVLVLAVAFAFSLVLGVPTSAPAQQSGVERLPDLDQQTPSDLLIAHTGDRARGRWLLGFQSAVRNIGDGPLVISGRRASRRSPTMRTQQLISRSVGAADAVVNTSGRLRYAVSPDHQHWHLLRFDRYELRRAGGGGRVVRDRKTGFCLGDRYRVLSLAVVGAPARPRYTSRCGLARPGLLAVTEGISVGYGDNYQPYLEGQSLPLNGLRAGRYVLVHRVNGDRSLRELDYGNNAASVLLDIRWRRGAPRALVLASCPDTDRCDLPASGAARSSRTAAARPVPFGAVSANWRRPGRPSPTSALCGLGGLSG
jgi:Lysyl oxidase